LSALGFLVLVSTLNLIDFSQLTVQISPNCGPAEPGFNIVINANGFKTRQ
jgi:hypothetical protein